MMGKNRNILEKMININLKEKFASIKTLYK